MPVSPPPIIAVAIAEATRALTDRSIPVTNRHITATIYTDKAGTVVAWRLRGLTDDSQQTVRQVEGEIHIEHHGQSRAQGEALINASEAHRYEVWQQQYDGSFKRVNKGRRYPDGWS